MRTQAPDRRRRSGGRAAAVSALLPSRLGPGAHGRSALRLGQLVLCTLALLGLTIACAEPPSETASPPPKLPPRPAPSILLITLDTTRADTLGVENPRARTPNLDRLASSSTRYAQAYATAPMTAPAHASILTGALPSEHHVHENARPLGDKLPTVAELLRQRGYETAGFVSGFPLSHRFGFARGFDHYDDELSTDEGDGVERPADETTDRALAYLATARLPIFLWVHYFDPHAPYQPPEPYRSDPTLDPYLGEVAFVDHEIGRLLERFDALANASGTIEPGIVVVGDHGEALGEHGETFHGNLLYQGVMRVPLIVRDPGDRRGPEVVSEPISARRVFDRILAWTGESGEREAGPVLAEAMQPYLQYGWQPQVMAVGDRLKVIRSGTDRPELYDVIADPAEEHDLAAELAAPPELLDALARYPLPEASGLPPTDDATRRRLAALGYASWEGESAPRADGPRARDMVSLFSDLDRVSGMIERGEYGQAIPLLEQLIPRDPGNLTLVLRLAAAHSALGHDRAALAQFEHARTLRPDSRDVDHYLALHHLRYGRWREAAPLLERVVAATPDRAAAVEGLALVREQQGRLAEAAELLDRVVETSGHPAAVWAKLGDLRMATGDSEGAITAFEQARSLRGDAFERHLELGVLYLASRRLEAARDELDQVPASHPGYPMALFKRAQVSVLLGEPDSGERIRQARAHADQTTAPLIDREPLFRGR